MVAGCGWISQYPDMLQVQSAQSDYTTDVSSSDKGGMEIKRAVAARIHGARSGKKWENNARRYSMPHLVLHKEKQFKLVGGKTTSRLSYVLRMGSYLVTASQRCSIYRRKKTAAQERWAVETKESK
jgi:hypothetical protein